MSNFIQVTPFLHVDNLERAVAFFTEILGFETRFRGNNYAYVHRETTGFRILEQAPTVPHQATAASRTISTFVTSMGYMRNSGPSSTLCQRAMSMDLLIRPMASASCWCWRRTEICSRLGKPLMADKRSLMSYLRPTRRVGIVGVNVYNNHPFRRLPVG